MINVSHLSKTYRVHKKEPGLMGSVRSLVARKWTEKHALRDVSLRVEEGEILGLLGANGAGKTTLVKILAGIIHPNSGNVAVLGHTPWQRRNEFRRNIALVMGQKAQLWWDLPAADCFLLLREIYEIPKTEFDETLARLSHDLEVDDLLTTQIRRLSLGERMKMELIATLLHRPKVVFLDEPTIGLDLTAQRAIRNFILEYQHEHRPAMVVTSHYMEDIQNLCKRIVILRLGAVVYDGPLADIASKYAQHKVVTAQIEGHRGGVSGATPAIPASIGEVMLETDTQIKLKVSRHAVVAGAEYLLENFSVQDINIEEPDISALIEAVQRGECTS
ncbi:MAG: ATP-binding cassette domain-containing protein [Verrucomicrobia bacterium]|nr:ATP-binding cassette domain-containing protein [Verrucomicrobiota bacterium]